MMITTTRNSQWKQPQQKSKTKGSQSKGEIVQRTWKYRSTGIKRRKMKGLEKIMFYDEDAWLKLKVFSNPLIVKNIMTRMNFSTLKTARVVSKEWKKLANLELKRRKCCQWRLWLNWPDQQRILRNSDDVSWVEFDCWYMRYRDKDLNHFASLCGHRVKMLKLPKLEKFWGVPAQERAWDFLSAGKFPNLEILWFDPSSAINLSCASEPMTWKSNADTILPNLQRIEDIAISESSLLPSTFLKDKGHLVKSATLDSSSYDRDGTALNQITALVQAKPKLERLKINEIEGDRRPQLVKQIDLLLESSRESLRVLEIALYWDIPFYFQPQHFQSFTKLSTLHFCFDMNCCKLQKQLENFNLDILPNLTTVKIEVNTWTKLEFPNSLCCSPTKKGILTSVVNLELKYQRGRYRLTPYLFPSNWLPWLSTCFPNVKNLTTDNWRDTDDVLGHIFTLWPKLTSLSLTCLDFDNPRIKLDLDPVFTGLSTKKCKELRRNPDKMKINMPKEISMERTWPNLTSLQELKRLNFILLGSFVHPFWCPVSLISFIYAINLHPELKTTIRFDETVNGYRKFLEPLAPYARLQDLHGNDWKL